MDEIASQFRLKQNIIGLPDIYSGINISKRHIGGDVYYWRIGSEKYLNEAIRNIEVNMIDKGICFTSKTTQPFSSLAYRPELNDIKLCNDYQTRYYQNLVGILRVSVELGKINIKFEISYLSRYLM